MANWIHTLNLSDIWHKTKENDYQGSDFISIHDLAEEISNRLKKIKFTQLDHEDFNELNMDLQDIQEWFRDIKKDNMTLSDFNYVMKELYDFSDRALTIGLNPKKPIWIITTK